MYLHSYLFLSFSLDTTVFTFNLDLSSSSLDTKVFTFHDNKNKSNSEAYREIQKILYFHFIAFHPAAQWSRK